MEATRPQKTKYKWLVACVNSMKHREQSERDCILYNTLCRDLNHYLCGLLLQHALWGWCDIMAALGTFLTSFLFPFASGDTCLWELFASFLMLMSIVTWEHNRKCVCEKGVEGSILKFGWDYSCLGEGFCSVFLSHWKWIAC